VSEQNYYQFIQKQENIDDPRYSSYFQHAMNYSANILWLGNTIILLLITILLNSRQTLPRHSMLGRIIREYRRFFGDFLEEDLINRIFEFNQSLNCIKHSLVGLSSDSITDPGTIYLFDLGERQSRTLSIDEQNESINLAQGIISDLKRSLR